MGLLYDRKCRSEKRTLFGGAGPGHRSLGSVRLSHSDLTERPVTALSTPRPRQGSQRTCIALRHGPDRRLFRCFAPGFLCRLKLAKVHSIGFIGTPATGCFQEVAIGEDCSRYIIQVPAVIMGKHITVVARQAFPPRPCLVHFNLRNLDLSRFRAAPSARLSHLPFECDRAFPA